MTAPSSAPFAIRTSDAQAVAAADGEAKLLLEFSNDCWVEIKDAEGNVLTSGLMRGNTTHTLSGPAPFKVTLGNAPAARIVLDDRLVDTTIYVPRRGTVSRFTLNRE
jgi:cytoskeleton protein RodZ